jgi:GT2 family glycosyltransferase
MIKPVLSIIIVNYNTAKITVDCLKSIFADKGLEFDLTKTTSSAKTPTEIILIDNNSTDSSLTDIQKLKRPVKIIANKDNAGFGKGNNQGFKIARGNYILLLNTDTIILHSAISQSLDWLSSHPESYGCTAQLLNADKTIQASGGYFPNLGNIFTWCLGIDDLPLVNKIIKPLHPHTPAFYTHDSFYLKDHPQDWVTGAFMLVRKNILDQVGGFDPDYFMYSEELEMCYRIHQKNSTSQLWYLVGPQIIHLGGASSKNKQFSFDKEYQGILHFFQKHRPVFETKIVSVLVKINRLLRSTVYKLFSHA